ncbi:MAG: hypothetical protein IT236_11155 [Bacteroidia bacterium]|nr:hypothetical protein [Bacteroidia bacterium]
MFFTPPGTGKLSYEQGVKAMHKNNNGSNSILNISLGMKQCEFNSSPR